MKRWTSTIVVLFALAAVACGGGPKPTADDRGERPPEQPDAVATLLDHPFSAEQIRDEWVVGFTLKIRRWTPDAEAFEEWTVVGADSDGVDIESVVLDADGQPTTAPAVQHSTWVQLRDHASFPADRATREAVTRGTPLGELSGWLYAVDDPSGEVVTEFFFAEELPGAPVTVHVIKGGELVEVFEQVERSRP
jgi:hypothetical protein